MRVFFKGAGKDSTPGKPATGSFKLPEPADTCGEVGTGTSPDVGVPKSFSKQETEGIRQDLQVAAEFQRSLLPKEPPSAPGYDFGAYYRGARALSGDHYDFIACADGRIGVVIGDASGKGVAASLLITMTRALLHAHPEEAKSPEAVLRFINARLHPQIKRGTFVSMTYALLDPGAHTVRVANAGHLPTVVWRPRLKVVTVHPARGIVLGAGGPAIFDPRLLAEEIALDPGDRVLMITDGVNEAMAPGGQGEFGMEHLRKRLQADSDRSSAEFIRNIVAQIDIHRAGGEQSDDITIVTFRRVQ